ncbi:ATP-dependent nuclease subunit B [Lacticaseibacillus rhamnosus]|nr:ATP-dependent nuclease subunit B [Lacticaseibacillus rhamnosus GG]AZZ24552.1 ATP-dependent nuclease subunit B [Lacticaseibacillus rhamnosus]MSC24812.1 ATP-dependent nuclease subunit B [Lacticaseibacillus rhamnosus]PTV05513.1 ATP-dependent nuclease subunit B [Lacticaseibacillus rhamnosus]QFG50464.1 ATP-dependent nuclease subunit B [Lacticaseibacillus rhamnosus]
MSGFAILSITRSQSQKSTCKDLSRNGQTQAIATEATYTPTSKRSCSRSPKKNRVPFCRGAVHDV